jgi:hypothetical protein
MQAHVDAWLAFRKAQPALAMLDKDQRAEMRANSRTYLALANLHRSEAQDRDVVTRGGATFAPFKPLERAHASTLHRLARKPNRRERMLARGAVPFANPWR